MKCPYCHKAIIPDIQAHSELIKRELKEKGERWVLIRLTAAMLVLGFLLATAVFGQTSDKRACTYSMDNMGEPHFRERIFIIGEREGVDDEGNPVQEWWVFFPDRPELHRNGKAVNYPKSKVVFMSPKWRQPIIVKGKRCDLWGAPSSGMSAEH